MQTYTTLAIAALATCASATALSQEDKWQRPVWTQFLDDLEATSVNNRNQNEDRLDILDFVQYNYNGCTTEAAPDKECFGPYYDFLRELLVLMDRNADGLVGPHELRPAADAYDFFDGTEPEEPTGPTIESVAGVYTWNFDGVNPD